MYGYIRPNRGELRVKDYERYRSLYCGLCRTLSRRFGPAARFAVNYDLTFLAMVLAQGGEESRPRFCPAHPLHPRRCVGECEALARAADCSMILAWWKLRDEARDGGFFRRIAARLGQLCLRRAYRKSCGSAPLFAQRVERSLEELDRLEREHCLHLDHVADCFASLLRAAAAHISDAARRRALEELLYHVGRSIYILDALDDFERDRRTGSYNPLLGRLDGDEPQQEREALRQTLTLSQHQAVNAFYLLPETGYTPILENILTLGLPQMTEMVLSGQWKGRKKLAREYARGTWGEEKI